MNFSSCEELVSDANVFQALNVKWYSQSSSSSNIKKHQSKQQACNISQNCQFHETDRALTWKWVPL